MTSSDRARPPVDLDLIADYVDGMLSAAESEAVARRIDADPDWARSADQLRAARATVAARLRSIGEATEPMPDAVFTRILGALPNPAIASLAQEVDASENGDAAVAHGVRGAAASVGARDDRVSGEPAAARQPTPVIPFDRARRRGRRRVWGNVAKIAAVLVVLAGIGTGVRALTGGTSHSSESAATKTSNGAAAPRAAAGSGATGLTTQASGHDYRNDLGAGPVATAQPSGGPFQGAAPGGPGKDMSQPAPNVAGVQGQIPPALNRLAVGGGLPACVAAVSSEFGAQPVAADFAYYRGQAAVVFRLGTIRQVAVGADCGLPGQGADVLASAG